MHPDLKYITKNYLTLDQLSESTGLDVNSIQKLIDEKIIPSASYTITTHTEISSPLGDKLKLESQTFYFPQSVAELIERHKHVADATAVKQAFKANFRRLLQSAPERAYAYGNIFDDEGQLIEQAFEKAFEGEWDAYTKGIYGICTLQATEEEIVKKEIAVQKLIEFNQKYGANPLSDAEKAQLIRLKAEFDSVANLFAPYQRATSSRGKYLDNLLKENGLAEFVKQYK